MRVSLNHQVVRVGFAAGSRSQVGSRRTCLARDPLEGRAFLWPECWLRLAINIHRHRPAGRNQPRLECGVPWAGELPGVPAGPDCGASVPAGCV